jgi:hypothetical protein
MEKISSNVLEMFKGAGVQWKHGVDPEAGIGLMKQLATTPIPVEQLVAKAFTQPGSATSGLAQYDLEQGARLLYPITTIFRNMIPRLTGGTGIQANWRSLTAVNPGNLNIGLSEGHRGGFMGQTVVDKFAAFKTSGMDNYVTEQAYLAAVTFQDLMALAATVTLQGTMEQEEQLDIGGNSSISLGTGATPTQGAVGNTGGFLSNGATYSVIVVPLTYLGMRNSVPPTVSGTGALSGGAVALPYTRTNADGSTDQVQGFSGIQSAASAAINLSGGTATQVINAVTTAVNGAIGYAWFMGATAGTERLVKITGYPTAQITNTNSTGQQASALPATDTSTFSLNYDGMLTQILASGSGAYVRDLGGAPLTTSGSGSGGLAEFDTLIADRIANYRLVPTDIFMSPTDQAAASALLLTGNTNLAPFFMGDSEDGLAAAVQMKVYNNKVGYGTPQLEVHAHPFIPAGTIIFYSRTNPYPLSNVPNLIRKLCRRDYWQVDWPVVTLQRTLGVYFDAVLQMYFPPAFGVITGVKS